MAFFSGSFSVGGNVFFRQRRPQNLWGRLCFFSPFFALDNAHRPSPHSPCRFFRPLPFRFVSDPLSVFSLFFARPSPPTAGKGGSGAASYFFPAPPSAGRERKTCRRRERRNLQEKGGVNRRAVKILKTRGGTFAFAKKKVVFSPKGRPTRGNAGKCRKNLFFG